MTPTTKTEAPALSTPTPSRRADALDALRGFAILTMALSGMVPFGVLPGWMYHAQVPPPDHVFNAATAPAGITWVDLVFPFFLFSMGAAIPLALQRRVKRGDGWPRLVLHAVKRGVLLGAFALYVQAVATNVISKTPNAQVWLLGLLGFGLPFAALARLPASWSIPLRAVTRLVGWGGGALLLWLLRYPDGSGFSEWRSDIIIVVLANVAVFGSLAWLISRHNWTLRAMIMIGLIALRLSHDQGGWVEAVWNFTPIPWMYRLYYLQYLCIVIPGTMVGDLVLDYLRKSASVETEAEGWPSWRSGAIAVLMLALVVWVVAGYYERWTWQTPLAAGIALAAGAWLFTNARTPLEHCLCRVFAWGACWLIIGMVFEPYEGGIKKDHPTLSYYFVTTGLACFSLIFFEVVGGFAAGRWALKLLVANGQNPMIAYVGIRNLVPPVLALTGISAAIVKLDPSPWAGAAIAGGKVLLLALAVALFTRLRVYWRT